MVTAQSREYIRAFGFYKDGFLPNPGGWLNQPAKLMDVFLIIDSEIDKMAHDEAEKRKR